MEYIKKHRREVAEGNTASSQHLHNTYRDVSAMLCASADLINYMKTKQKVAKHDFLVVSQP